MLAYDFVRKLGSERRGWLLSREDTPVAAGAEVLLPDFRLRHRDGRAVLVGIVGSWTPEYLASKLRKIEAAGLGNLILVAGRGLAAGPLETVAPGRVLWFTSKPRVRPVLEASERVARRPA